MAEGAPLLREYVGKTCIEGSNPSGSANVDLAGFLPKRGDGKMRAVLHEIRQAAVVAHVDWGNVAA